MKNESMNDLSQSTLDTLLPEDVNYDPGQFETLKPGYLFGEFQNYRLEKKIGEGGMGQTWLAMKVSGGEDVQQVVCKILSDRIRENAGAMSEVQRVFDLTKKAFHQNICPLLGIETDRVFGKFLIMAYIENGTLADWFEKQEGHENGLKLESVLPILSPIAGALDFIHELGILHRDVKPQNIMFQKIGRRDVPCLIDFGIAARIRPENATQATVSLSRTADTMANSSSGTPVYMAPEQMQTHRQNGRADQYALAMVLYELTHGKLPFRNGNLMEIAFAKMQLRATSPHLTDAANAALDRALSIFPDARFSTCTEFLETLEKAQNAGISVSKPDVLVKGSAPKPEPVPAPKPEPNPERKPGDRMVKTVDGIEYAFRWCPPGTFMMGDGKDAHEVTLTHGFWMLETQVTQKMWKSVMRGNPSRFPGEQNPVECVSWDDCQEFCRVLSSKISGKVDLPTEAQWEYACRAGTTGDYAGELGKMAWYYDANSRSTHPVRQKQPNAWGLYDMHGNVWEWCEDRFGPYSPSPTSDPTGPDSGSSRVYRGGSWGNNAEYCRSAYRYYYEPGSRNGYLGFRIVLADPAPGN
ncbi:MAG: hypothetical protein E7029_11170 [Planctomycetaceae bacterium]|nr:hypothetical protein [Planctomycetaceae bacterium]